MLLSEAGAGLLRQSLYGPQEWIGLGFLCPHKQSEHLCDTADVNCAKYPECRNERIRRIANVNFYAVGRKFRSSVVASGPVRPRRMPSARSLLRRRCRPGPSRYRRMAGRRFQTRPRTHCPHASTARRPAAWHLTCARSHRGHQRYLASWRTRRWLFAGSHANAAIVCLWDRTRRWVAAAVGPGPNRVLPKPAVMACLRDCLPFQERESIP